MASILPNVPGTGSKIPISNYTAGMTDFYPNANRSRIVETSINARERVDIMPINSGLNQSLSDKYIEFRLTSSDGVFIDLTTLTLELKMTFNKPDDGGFKAGDADSNFNLVNGISNTLFKSVNVFLNDKLVESNPLYNYISYIKMLRSMPLSTMDSLGACGGLRDDFHDTTKIVPDNIIDAHLDKSVIPGLQRDGLDICFPLMLDITTLDMYLLDNVDLRIRLELADHSWYMAYCGQFHIDAQIQKAVLWVDRVIPHFNAMKALSDSIQKKPIQYIFNKSLIKTYVIGSNENNIILDQPFNNVIPEKLSMCFIDNVSFNGNLSRNPLHFPTLNVSCITISINGNTVYNLKGGTRAYYETLRSNGIQDDNMLTHRSFLGGRCLYTFNFTNEDMKDSVPVEMSANMRITIDFETPPPRPHILLLAGESVGILNIDSYRNIQCDVRA